MQLSRLNIVQGIPQKVYLQAKTLVLYSLISTSLLSLKVISLERIAQATMTIKPKLCILNNERQTCTDSVVIAWKGDKFKSICLFNQKQDMLITCWQEVSEGEVEYLVSLRESILFELKVGDEVVVATPLKVIKNFSKRVNRNRKRYPWSIF